MEKEKGYRTVGEWSKKKYDQLRPHRRVPREQRIVAEQNYAPVPTFRACLEPATLTVEDSYFQNSKSLAFFLLKPPIADFVRSLALRGKNAGYR